MTDLESITGPFYPQLAELGEFCPVDAAELPESYRRLLAHDDHMTVSVEAFHHSPVDVEVVDERRDGDRYSRTSVLVTQNGGRRVQFGVMSINTHGLPDGARAAIHSGSTPLGRILIRYNVLRRVELVQLYEVKPGPALRYQLGLEPGQVIFGRTARILVGGRPAVSLLEIVKA